MKCPTCNADLPPKKPKGRKKLYCSIACNPNAYKPKNAGLSHCQFCGIELTPSKTGRPKRNCSKRCSDLMRYSKRTKKPELQHTCGMCGSLFTSSKSKHNYCSFECRAKANSQRSSRKWMEQVKNKYPDRMRTAPCGWCGEDRTFEIGKSVVNAFHPKCTLEAQRARYRIKTVKRQTKLNPNRISADQVVREYGDACHICQEPIDMSLPRTNRMGLTIDHVVALSKGGTDKMDNLRPAHWICNNRKSNKPLEELIA